jgi:hypothetical protein
MIASEARIRRSFRPGFVLDDNVVGEAIERPGGKRFVFIHPDRMAQVVKAHRERPLALAAFLHGVAVHELTHLDGKMGDGHDEEFVSRREDLGAATAHLLPAIAVLVTKVLRLPERDAEGFRRIAKLERTVLDLREGAPETKRALVAVTRERDRLVAVRSAGESRAEKLLDMAVGVLRARPPFGVEAAYVDGFVGRNRRVLLGIVRGAFPGG